MVDGAPSMWRMGALPFLLLLLFPLQAGGQLLFLTGLAVKMRASSGRCEANPCLSACTSAFQTTFQPLYTYPGASLSHTYTACSSGARPNRGSWLICPPCPSSLQTPSQETCHTGRTTSRSFSTFRQRW